MKFNAEEWLSKHGGDAIKALMAMHTEVEDREADNATARQDKREAQRAQQEAEAALATARSQVPEGVQVMDDDTKAELERYRAMGTPDELTSQLQETRQHAEVAVNKLFDTEMRRQLKEAGVPDKYLDQAMVLIKNDETLFKVDEEDDEADVEFDMDKFKEGNANLFEAEEVNLVGGRGKGSDSDSPLKDVAKDYLNNRFAVPNQS